MTSYTLKLIIAFLFIPFMLLCLSQKSLKGQGFNNTIHFDETGKLNGEVPELIDVNNQLTVTINAFDESRLKDLKAFEKRWESAKMNLKKLKDDGQGDFLLKVYGLDLNDLISRFDNNKVVLTNQIMSIIDNKRYYFNNTLFTYIKDEKSYSAFISLTKNPCLSISKFQFDLERTAPLKDFIFQKYISTVNTYTKIDFHKIDTLSREGDKILSIARSVDSSYIQFVSPYIIKNETIPRDIGTNWLNDQITRSLALSRQLTVIDSTINAFFDQVKKNKGWVEEWLWYSGGKPMLNPFSFCDPDDLVAPDTSEIYSLKEKILARTGLIKSMSTADLKSLKRIDSLIDDRNKLSILLFNKINNYNKYQKFIKENDTNIDDFRSVREKLNSVTLFTTNTDCVKGLFGYMRNHDASQAYSIMNSLTHDEYLEEDRVIILNHNLKKGEKYDWSIKEEVITNDRPGWIEDVEKGVEVIADNVVKEKPPKMKFALKKAAPKKEKKVNIFKELDPGKLLILKNLKKDISDKIGSLKKNLKYLNQIPIQNNPLKSIQEKLPDSATFHSEVCNYPKKIKGATIISYTFTGDINSKDKPPKDTFNFRVNKLYRIFPAAGFAYTAYPDFINVTYDKNAQPQFTQKITHPVNYIVGLKVHPFRKIDIRSTRIFWKNDDKNRLLLWSRISFTVAFGVTEPLNNLFAGVGLDVFPGLCLTAGTHLNKYTHISFKSGNPIEKNIYRTGIYIGVLTDVALVAQIVKMIGF